MSRHRIYPILQALLAAVLFGASAPLAKILLGDVEPIPLAALLYLGSGIGLLCVKAVQHFLQGSSDQEARIVKKDLPWLTGAILAGGVAAPIVLLFSLQSTPAATASLLLNFESVATTLIAALAFRESISRRAWWAVGLITLASILLSINSQANWGLSLGALGIVTACILWGVDNNFTRNISAKDPLVIVTIKGLAAGSFSLTMALVLGNSLPALKSILGALALGCLSYGISIVLFIHALRGLGAARTSALFGTAPLAGMLLSFLIFREFPGWMFLLAVPFMFLGMLFLINEKHEHEHDHSHATDMHEHAHVHEDGHHNHAHVGDTPRKHSHLHTHDKMTHAHHHMPDIHHRHEHKSTVGDAQANE